MTHHSTPQSNYRKSAVSVAIRYINTLTILKVVKAEAHLGDVADPVRRSAQAEAWVHRASHAFAAPCQSELDRTVTQVRLEFMDDQQRLCIHIDINAADAFAIAAGGNLRLLQQGSKSPCKRLVQKLGFPGLTCYRALNRQKGRAKFFRTSSKFSKMPCANLFLPQLQKMRKTISLGESFQHAKENSSRAAAARRQDLYRS
jgi:hypothetical protein